MFGIPSTTTVLGWEMFPFPILMHARVTIAENASQRINDVRICRYFVFVTLKNPNGAAITTNAARNILKCSCNKIFEKGHFLFA